ncbi:hypothetical protein [uncultured Adlercreutzia sp.]|uniref:hypothetical protein n=1 Tax=uncultured Adlercreutzia sp. TaxID=875803 RepID=UPI0025F80901|nr:hypothetical protein [uncultured Adlercreutzia sp.]MCI9262191.1 hypothetical protein [Eggerthellaceae bacterium]
MPQFHMPLQLASIHPSHPLARFPKRLAYELLELDHIRKLTPGDRAHLDIARRQGIALARIKHLGTGVRMKSQSVALDDKASIGQKKIRGHTVSTSQRSRPSDKFDGFIKAYVPYTKATAQPRRTKYGSHFGFHHRSRFRQHPRRRHASLLDPVGAMQPLCEQTQSTGGTQRMAHHHPTLPVKRIATTELEPKRKKLSIAERFSHLAKD